MVVCACKSHYLGGVIVYGALSLLLAVPLGSAAGYLLSRELLFALNVQLDRFVLLPQTVLVQIGVGLLVPLLVSLWPVGRGTAVTVREAISAYGLGRGHYGAGLVDQWLGQLRGIPRVSVLVMRNTFRRSGRVALTELTLVGAGAIFMMEISTGARSQSTIDEVWQSWGFDVFLVFDSFQRVEEVEAAIATRPGVQRVEMWIWMDAIGRLPGDTTGHSERDLQLRALPRDSQMFHPELITGRSLDPKDGHAVVLNQSVANDLGIGVGDQILIELGGGKETVWTVVGTAFDIGVDGDQNTVFMPRDVLSGDLHRAGKALVAQIVSRVRTRQFQDRLVETLKRYFESQGVKLAFSMGQIENRELASSLWDLIGGLLQLMTILMAAVGSIGLSGTLSINVIERHREIGVMRAIGASTFDIAALFIGEGLLLGGLSWLLALPLSVLGGQFFVRALGRALQFPFSYQFASTGMWLWLGIVLILAFLASWFPARRAAGFRVHEILAYE